METSDKADVVMLLMDLSYRTAMIAVGIEENREAGMEGLDIEFQQLDDLLSAIDEQVFSWRFAQRAIVAKHIAKRVAYKTLVHATPKTRQ